MKDIFVYGLLIPKDMKCNVAKLNDYELVIADSGHFSVVPKKGSCVYGVVFSVDEGTLSMYDCYEGYDSENAEGSFYIRKGDARVDLVRFARHDGGWFEVLDGADRADFYMQPEPFKGRVYVGKSIDDKVLSNLRFSKYMLEEVVNLAKMQRIPTEQYYIAFGKYASRVLSDQSVA